MADVADGELDHFDLVEAALNAEGIDDAQLRGQYTARFRSWTQSLKMKLRRDASSRQQAATILQFLHDRGLTGQYDASASNLSGVFQSGHFNCVSSSILFIALCQQCEVDVTAVRRPGHVACAIVDEGAYWLVETTNRQVKPTIFAPVSFHMQPEQPTFDRISTVQLLSAIYYNQAIQLAEAQEFPAAVDAASAALRLDPANDDVRANVLATINNWSVQLVFDDRFDDASRILNLGIQMGPEYQAFSRNNLFLHQRWVAQLWSEGKYTEAIRILEVAGRQHPDEDFYQIALRRTHERRRDADVYENQHEN